MKRLKINLFALCLLALCSCQSNQPNPADHSVPHQSLQDESGTAVNPNAATRHQQVMVKNGRLVDRDGKTVVLRGFGLGHWLCPEGYFQGTGKVKGWALKEFEAGVLDVAGRDKAFADNFWFEWWSNYMTEMDVRMIKGWGCNHVRLVFDDNNLMPRKEEQPDYPPFLYKEKNWEIFDNFMNWCEAYHLYVIFDMHGCPGSLNGMLCSDGIGEGVGLIKDLKNRRLMLDLWKKIAQRYRHYDCVIGYDIPSNEPLFRRHGIPQSELRALAVETTKAIRMIDPSGIMFVEGDEYSHEFECLEPIDWDSQIVLSYHNYEDPMNLDIWHLYPLMKKYGTLTYMGEGAANQASIAVLEDGNPPVGWAKWGYKWWRKGKVIPPITISNTEGFDKIMKYWEGTGPKPSVDDSKKWLMEMARSLRTDGPCCTRNDKEIIELGLSPNDLADKIEIGNMSPKAR